MKMMKTIAVASGIAAAMFAAACSDPALPAAPVVAAPTVTETFTGVLTPSSTNTHQFAVSQVGGIRVTLTDVEPAAAIGIAIGTPSVAGCLAASTDTAVPGSATQLSGTATVIGNFCVSVSDVGNLVEPVTYVISVLHS